MQLIKTKSRFGAIRVTRAEDVGRRWAARGASRKEDFNLRRGGAVECRGGSAMPRSLARAASVPPSGPSGWPGPLRTKTERNGREDNSIVPSFFAAPPPGRQARWPLHTRTHTHHGRGMRGKATGALTKREKSVPRRVVVVVVDAVAARG